MGKGGGAPAPTSQTVQQSNIPEYARPYFEDIMTRGQTASQATYQPFTGDRVADFNPMQQQSFNNVSNMNVSPLMGQGAGMTGAAGIGGLNAGANYSAAATNPGTIQQYMSPYMQNVVDFQKSQAVADYNRAMPSIGAGASKAGAFGGTRHALVESEANRNLQNQLGGIQATGSQNAFDAANKNLQFGTSAGLQGLQTANQAGQNLAQIGQGAFTQQMGINQALQQSGGIQQAADQQQKDLNYEEFMRQQQYPWTQLQNLSSLLRGSVVSPNQTMFNYAAQPSTASQIGGLGLGIGALSQAMKKDGGIVKGFAEGGEVPGGGMASNVSNLVKILLGSPNPQQDVLKMNGTPLEKSIALQKVMSLKQAGSNQQALDAGEPQTTVMQDMGLGGMDAGVVEDAEYAGGGIVAFADGGAPPGVQYLPSEPSPTPLGRMDDDFHMARRQGVEEGYWRRELAKKYGPKAGLQGLFTSQSDAERTLAKGILDKADGMNLAELRDFAQNPEAYMGRPPAGAVKAGVPGVVPTPQPSAEAPAGLAGLLVGGAGTGSSSGMRTPAPVARPGAPEMADVVGDLRSARDAGPTKDAAEAELRARLDKVAPEKAFDDELANISEQAKQAVVERDKDRWLALAMGGFAAAAGDSPHALKNFAAGLGLTTKQMADVNKDFKKAESERQKLEREQRSLQRAQRLDNEKAVIAAGHRVEDRKDKYDTAIAGAQSKLNEVSAHIFGTQSRSADVESSNRSAERRTAAAIGATKDAKGDALKAAYVTALQKGDKAAAAAALKAIEDYTRVTKPQSFEKPDDFLAKLMRDGTPGQKAPATGWGKAVEVK